MSDFYRGLTHDAMPASVWHAARSVAAKGYLDTPDTMERMMEGGCDSWPIVFVTARAIMAERDRCAEVARRAPGLIWQAWGKHATGEDIALNILEGGEPTREPVRDRPTRLRP